MAEPSAKKQFYGEVHVSVDGGRTRFSSAETIRQDQPGYPSCASCGLPLESGIAHANESGCIAALRLAIQYEKVNRQVRQPTPQSRVRLAS